MKMTNQEKWEKIKKIAASTGRNPYEMLLEWVEVENKEEQSRSKINTGGPFNNQRMKLELRDAARQGIGEYLTTIRGASRFGPNVRITEIDDTNFHVVFPDGDGPMYFRVSVKEDI
jgi:hypothetical protein